MQHVYGPTGIFGNECADHAAALGSFGLISSRNAATRWVHVSLTHLPVVVASIALLLFCVGSQLFIVLTGVTLWFVTNPLTIFKVHNLECVTGWATIDFLQRRGTIATTFSQQPGRVVW